MGPFRVPWVRIPPPPLDPIDIILLTHDRLGHLQRTVEALLARTPEPIRITIVDNASGPQLRNWLAGNRALFAGVITRPHNDYVPAFQDGIDATTSDPFVVADPDLVVPELEPSWLARILDLMERHPDFGLIGTELDVSNLPPGVLTDEQIAALKADVGLVDGELWEGNAGLHFQTVRRAALREPYYSDFEACEAVRRAGWRVGRVAGYKVHHLGFDDIRDDPGYVLRKEGAGGFYPTYSPLLSLLTKPPTLEELALSAPLARELERRAIPARSVLEIAWRRPLLGRCLPDVATSSWRPPLPLADGAAAAVCLAEPDAGDVDAAIGEAARVAGRLVLLLCTLETVGGRLADALAPAGWSAREAPGAGAAAVALARAADRDHDVAARLGYSTVQDREAWLRAFDAMPTGDAELRLFVFERAGAVPAVGWPALDRSALPAPPDAEPQPRPRRRRFGLRRR